MDWKRLVPGSDKSNIIHRLRELEHQAGALPVISALFFHEGIKELALYFDIFIPIFIRMFLLSVVFGVAYVYHDKRYRAWKKAKETVNEKKSKLDQKQSQIGDYHDN